MPLYYLRQAGLDPDRDSTLLRFDVDVGKHGDTGASELEVLRAVQDGRADAGAVGHATWLRWLEQGQVNTTQVDSVWTSPPYDHCNFTALPDFDRELAARWQKALLRMNAEDPRWRRVMDLEGLNRWVAGHKEGYADVLAAFSP